MRPCKPRWAQEEEPEDLFYALRTIEIDGLPLTGRIYDIAFAHKICTPSCELLVYLNQKETRRLDTDWQESQIAMEVQQVGGERGDNNKETEGSHDT